MKTHSFLFISFITCMLWIGCSKDRTISRQEDFADLSAPEVQTALELVNSFRENIQGQSRSNSITDLTILMSAKKPFHLKRKEHHLKAAPGKMIAFRM